MNENWYVFAVALLCDVTVEAAFGRWDYGKSSAKREPREVINRIMSMRDEGLSYSNIGREVGMKEYIVRKRVAEEMMRRDLMS